MEDTLFFIKLLADAIFLAILKAPKVLFQPLFIKVDKCDENKLITPKHKKQILT